MSKKKSDFKLKDYLSSLKNTYISKAFFMDKLPANVCRIIDYGCADGSFIEFLRKNFGQKYYYSGVEINQDMKKMCNDKNITVYQSLNNIVTSRTKLLSKTYGNAKTLEDACINFSSTLHEINNSDLENVFIYSPAVVAIRDMNVHTIRDDNNEYTINLIHKFAKYYPSKFKDFCDNKEFNNRNLNLSDCVHFMLKYFYDNGWERELKEDYLSTNDKINMFIKWSSKIYEVIYYRKYNLQYLLDKWRDDGILDEQTYDLFSRDLITTHQEIIFRRKTDNQ